MARNGGARPEEVPSKSHKKAWWRCTNGHEWKAVIASRSAGAGCPYCAGKKVQIGFNDLASQMPELAREWHPTKNGDMTPDAVTRGSHKKVWWRCGKGHEWKAVVKSRASGCGCPYCTNRIIIPGENDLGTAFGSIADQWHPTKNGDLRPEQFSYGSGKLVWWLCEAGHEWKARIRDRTCGNSNCPHCNGHYIAPRIKFLDPSLVGQWHPTKNGSLKPEDVLPNSHRAVWWKCNQGHEWKAMVSDRNRGTGCPYCTGRRINTGENDLKTIYPQIAAQWHPTKNGELCPDQVTPHSNRYVWWRCEKGHDYHMMVNSRTNRGSGCPYCAGRRVLPGFNDLATKEPRIAAEWYQPLNGDLTPGDVTIGSNKRVWWQCQDGHVWQTPVYSRTGSRKRGCPVCAGNVKRPRVWPDWDRTQMERRTP